MDTAVALVQSYLHLCGYFTVTEYPVVEATRGRYRTVTDLDVLAVRFPGARRIVPRRSKSGVASSKHAGPEPIHDPLPSQVDMIIGEVKEGKAELNRGASDPLVLRTALIRFGCCAEADVDDAVQRLLRKGDAHLSHGSPAAHHVRLVAFGSRHPDRLGYPCEVVLLKDIIDSMQSYLREHWNMIRHAQFKDTALSLLTTMEKAAVDGRGARD